MSFRGIAFGVQSMPVVSVTRLHLRSYRFLLPFLFYTVLSTWQAKRSQGNVNVSLLIDVNNTFWTRTVWLDEMSLQGFVKTGFHLRVMPKLQSWASEASAVHWEQETAQLPDWYEAHQRMVRGEGHRGILKYPSPAHINDEFVEPKGFTLKFF